MLNGLERPHTSDPGTMDESPEGNCGRQSITSKISVILLVLVYCLFIPGFSVPYWKSRYSTFYESYYGIWKSCSEDYNTVTHRQNYATRGKICINLIDADDKPLQAIQGLMIISLTTLILATALLICWLCSYSRYFCAKFFIIMFFVFSFGASVAAVTVFALDNLESSENFGFGWCFYLVCVSAGLLFFVQMVLCWVPSRRIDPCDKRRGRYGSNSPESPPPRYVPPTLPSPMQPQQGISMVELPDPGLATSTKPERDAYHMYPDSPPRYEEIESYTHLNSPPSYEQVANEKPHSPTSAAEL